MGAAQKRRGHGPDIGDCVLWFLGASLVTVEAHFGVGAKGWTAMPDKHVTMARKNNGWRSCGGSYTERL